ncbi:aspartate aminotransferase family protein [Desulfoscipio gibsoniae]|uniref:Ornithine/acetylornithine aminotransferase n=1 Tax=Desulfoscipio gibsoniae DSM 7213 TaxID=767817 RepID=R4KG10_9FIRM|nr:aspartate aminotransferase family protein [Desulfoscipio gibsoniae]AGL02153.1 ornithine/acetylornithine aminotransferase [Desulfoscipio gibsoniae DSM 7213]
MGINEHASIVSPELIISVTKAQSLQREEVRTLHKHYGNASLVNLMGMLNFDRQFVRAQGTRLWDSDGNDYLDFLGGYGSLNLGHNHPQIIAALEQVKEMPNLLQASVPTIAAALLHNLAVITPGKLKKSFLGNSGAEAIEGALKLARAATGKKGFIFCQNSFHGKSFGALSVTGRDKYRKPFEPLLSECIEVPFGDINALRRTLKEHQAAAFIVEPIQGEGGVITPPPGYLPEAAQACREAGTLFIADEIQTGFGRTGAMFACQHENVEPDIMCLAKSLGGGIMPIGAFITTEDIWHKAYGNVEKATLHTSTFGGNTWAATAGVATIEVLVKENLSEAAGENGRYFMTGLKNLQKRYPLLQEVRGRGLLIGIELAQPGNLANKATMGVVSKLSNEYLGSMVAGELLNKHRIVTAYTLNNPNVIRLEPPLIVNKEEIDYVLNALEDVLKRNKGFFSFAATSAKTVLKTIRKK